MGRILKKKNACGDFQADSKGFLVLGKYKNKKRITPTRV